MQTRSALLLAGLLFGGAGLAASFGGCTSSSGGSGGSACNLDPFQCATGTTCAVNACTCPTSSCTLQNCTPTFGCVPSLSEGVEGTSCNNELGKATCADGLTCIQEKGVNMGVGQCTPYCDLQHPCPGGLACAPVDISLGPPSKAPVVHVCLVPGDGGIIVVDTGIPDTPIGFDRTMVDGTPH